MKKHKSTKPRYRDIIDPSATRPLIRADGLTIVFPAGWTKKQRDEWRESITRRAPYRSE